METRLTDTCQLPTFWHLLPTNVQFKKHYTFEGLGQAVCWFSPLVGVIHIIYKTQSHPQILFYLAGPRQYWPPWIERHILAGLSIDFQGQFSLTLVETRS